MTMQRAYLSLAAFYTLLIVIGAIALVMGGGTPLALIQLGVGILAVIGLWGYTLHRGFLNPRMWRPLCGLLAIAAIVQLAAVLSGNATEVDTTWMLVSAIFTLLLLAILYRYGDRDQDLWASPEDIEGGRRLEALLDSYPTLVAERREGGRHTTVSVAKVGPMFRASVTRRQADGVERFEERFSNPATLAYFLDRYTCLTASDFERQNDEESRERATPPTRA